MEVATAAASSVAFNAHMLSQPTAARTVNCKPKPNLSFANFSRSFSINQLPLFLSRRR
ncbi:hypothetical protein COLO4_09083 [Corchorus olitorius]|uniref:Uncharacterized protein n=1 Tax=Corchorus olitorius TaxID=93759 RepID=A0A1R3KD92_9ROSI|nr:hypothetical protein COLO4_09083 [Corchorus olitorius]